ncbi:hypothetical protein HS041_15865 [Planomonospora sp. ID67723]|uniref:hypothetical protein n=1 Tax=Planomonospora sp. ID67723 TaxID=2738134 RepID=UPI0018C38D56|nr:hypothetical protein [Planomonospora sp. ID67723]MBG0829245.1 hypothetical protein [Planomonospora sp. ID67723]
MNARKRAAVVSAAAFLTTAMVTATAPGASAAPTDCSYQVSGRQASSYCATGAGEHRIRVLQRHFLPEIGLIPIIGPWQPAGTASVTGITPHQIVDIWVETR